jgi:hypothetical protein
MGYDNTNRKKFKMISVRKGDILDLDNYPNFHRSGNVKGMREKFYGKDALLLQCGEYIYNLSSNPELFKSL